MKIALLVFLMTMSSQLLGKTNGLTYKDSFEVKKTIVNKDLPVNFIKLYRAYNFSEKRMIAGEFTVSHKKAPKKTYLDGLRSKLQNSKGPVRF